MSVTPEDLLDWACYAPVQTETEIRAVVSRAYYAAFHRCQEWHGSSIKYQSPMQRQNIGEHEFLILQLKNPNLGNPKLTQQLSQDLGARLEVMKPLRVLADYRLRHRMRPGLEDQACDEASEILRLAI